MVAMRDSSKAALAVGRFAGWEPAGVRGGRRELVSVRGQWTDGEDGFEWAELMRRQGAAYA